MDKSLFKKTKIFFDPNRKIISVKSMDKSLFKKTKIFFDPNRKIISVKSMFY